MLNGEEYFKTGTTLVGLRTKNFLIMGSDQQATWGNLRFLNTRKSDYISSDLIFSGAGTAGHSSYLYSLYKYFYFQRGPQIDYQLEPLLNFLNKKILTEIGPLEVSTLLGYKNRKKDTYHIYSVDCLGSYSEVDFFSLGSGGNFASGILNSEYNSDLSLEEGKKIIEKALKCSKSTDIYSGGKSTIIVLSSSLLPEEYICE